jgi:tetratricopeptide (TPR) repeat protein
MTVLPRPGFVSFLLVLLSFGSSSLHGEQDYAARFKELSQQKADAQIEPLLKEWREKSPNDPDAWITSANYYFGQRQTIISTKKPGKGDFALTNKKTGKTAGSISFEPDKGTAKRAVELLQEATKKFPDRLDIWCGLAFIQQENGDFDSELATLKSMVAYAHDHPAQLQWLKGEKLSDPPDQFLAKKLHSYGLYYEKKENPEDDQRFFKIATLATERFPTLPYGFNDVAMFYSIGGDQAKTREWLEKANRVAPKDTLVLMNLGRICSQLGDNPAARKWYEEVVKVEPNGEYAEQAKEKLGELKK